MWIASIVYTGCLANASILRQKHGHRPSEVLYTYAQERTEIKGQDLRVAGFNLKTILTDPQ